MKVLVIDDHPLILSAIQSVIQGLADHVNVIAACNGTDARLALQNTNTAGVDLILLDLHLGDMDGFELLAEFRDSYPGVPVVVVSASDRSGDVIRALDMGAMGFVSKRSSNDTLIAALKQVIAGGVYVPPMSMSTDNVSLPQAQESAALSLRQLGLTPRQNDVLALLLKGQSNKLIARTLNLSVETVKDHVAAVLRALNVNSRTQAVIAVSQMWQQQSASNDESERISAWRLSQA
jgi:DNA-binding NarL/FixJ family response regulator